MNNKQSLGQFLGIMGTMHNREITKPLLQVYYNALLSYTDEQCESAFALVNKTFKFFPKPVEIIDIIKRTSRRTAPVELEAKPGAQDYGRKVLGDYKPPKGDNNE